MSTKTSINASLEMDRDHEITIDFHDDIPYSFFELLKRSNNSTLYNAIKAKVDDKENNKPKKLYSDPPEYKLNVNITKSGKFSLGSTELNATPIMIKDNYQNQKYARNEDGSVKYDWDNVQIYRHKNVSNHFFRENLRWKVTL